MLCGRGSGWQPTRDQPVADAMGVAQGALHCHKIPWRCSFPSNRGVRMCVRDPSHRDRVQLEACAAERHPWGHVSLEEVCGTGCAVQEDRRAARIVRSGSMLRRSTPCPCRAAVLPGFARRHRGCGQALSWCPPHSTAQAAACRFVKESGAGGRWSRVRWEQHALRTPSPLLRISVARCGGGAWPWAAHPREAMEERVPSSARGLITQRCFTVIPCTSYILLDPEATPRLPPMPILTRSRPV